MCAQRSLCDRPSLGDSATAARRRAPEARVAGRIEASGLVFRLAGERGPVRALTGSVQRDGQLPAGDKRPAITSPALRRRGVGRLEWWTGVLSRSAVRKVFIYSRTRSR